MSPRARPHAEPAKVADKRRKAAPAGDPLASMNPATRSWFEETFSRPTDAQRKAWPAILAQKSTLLVAPTGSGKTLAAFLCAIDRLLFSPEPEKAERCRLIYVSPIKALAFDIERNLRAPLSGIERTADRLGIAHRSLEVAIRTGDTAPEERARFLRRPADILITTPESLYLMLTSQVRETLRSVETLIVDEIHALASTKRGTHLFLSLERLEALRPPGAHLQRIGLSATQKPLEEVARLLGGSELREDVLTPRKVVIADAHAPRPMELTIEVPVEDMGDLKSERSLAPREAGQEEAPRTIWTSIHPRLVELIRAHRSTMIFANNRRLAERLANAINELAQEPLARAHHGSVAREQRVLIEDALKSGALRCIVATSSLELGLDIGSVELVVQIEAPPSVSAGIQRVGRANHQVGGNPRGTLFPKHRGDLVACAEASRRMRAGEIEITRYPRNALDVLAQQIVAVVASEEEIEVEQVFALVRRAAPFGELTRQQFHGVLDMLSGLYPSDEFAELRPRITWHRERGVLAPRAGAKRLAIANAGVIPDRGLYGVFLAGAASERASKRVGELDEEMVFEARTGEVFVLGASSWRIEEITHDRVLVTPAPGQPGKMPFWRGDGLGRSVELGRGVGALLRTLSRADDARALTLLGQDFGLEPRAARNLLRYVRDQEERPYALPTDRRLVIERFIDEVGDYRVCLLSPFGARLHAPLALCMSEKSQRQFATPAETVWTDDGLVMRFPDRDEPPDIAALLPGPDEVEELLMHALGNTPLFASHFRECAARALLLPRRSPQRRAPLWAQRKRAASLLQVASQFGSFPILLETYRECLQDVFDVPQLINVMQEIVSHRIDVQTVDADKPSPFAATLLFSYIGNFIYDADAPLAERRAAALAIDPVQLRELLGQAELKDLLDPDAIEDVSRSVARLGYPPRYPDELHDLLLFVGDLSLSELEARIGPSYPSLLEPLVAERRALRVHIAGEERAVAVEDVARYRDAVGIMPPPGLPSVFLEPVAAPLMDLLSRYARTHGPFTVDELSARYALPSDRVTLALDEWVARGRLLRGELHPQKPSPTYCDGDVMRAIKRRSLASLRKQVEPVDTLAYARFLLRLHGIGRGSRGLEVLRSALERLESAPLFLADLEREILPARVQGFVSSDLDLLLASGEVMWRGLEVPGKGAGRIALYFRDNFEALAPAATPLEGALHDKIREVLKARGAVFFYELTKLVGGFPPDVLDALWELVWAGEVTNDTLQPLRSLAQGGEPDRKRGVRVSRVLPGSEGRWTLLPNSEVSPTERRAALVRSLLRRHGVLVRDALKAEGVQGGFSAVYEVLKAMEDEGRVRRGYFVEHLGAAQFVEPGLEEPLRAQRDYRERDEEGPRMLASIDPASPWGAALAWPATPSGRRPMRATGANVVLSSDARPLAWLGRSEHSLLTFSPEEGADRAALAAQIARALADSVDRGGRRALLLAQVDGDEAQLSWLAPALEAAGFTSTMRGLFKRGSSRSHPRTPELDSDPSDDDEQVS